MRPRERAPSRTSRGRAYRGTMPDGTEAPKVPKNYRPVDDARQRREWPASERRGLLGKNNEICDPPPSQRGEENRRALHDLQESLRAIAPRGVRSCGIAMVPGDAGRVVDVMTRETERGRRAHFHGLRRCSCWYGCVKCSAQLRSGRGDDVTTAAAWWRGGGGAVELLTFTVAHYVTDDPRELIMAFRRCWRRLWAGAPGKRLKAALAIRHYVRGSDQTYGRNGLHPHFHVVLFTRPSERAPRAVANLKQRWADVVRAELGREHMPSCARGVDLRASKRDDYLAKLGLELVSSATKAGKRGGRTPWAVARAAAAGDHDSIVLWDRYCKAMRGQHQLSWSKDLRKLADIKARTDQQIVDNEGDDAAETHVASIPAELWSELAFIPGARFDVLRAAETGGRAAIAQVLALHLYGLAPPEPGERPDAAQLDLFAAIAPFEFPHA